MAFSTLFCYFTFMKYEYCPKCGHKYNENSNIEVLVCENCKYEFFQNSKPCTTVLVIKDDKVLLGKRAIDPDKDKWDFVGGFLKFGEDPIECAIREVKEETGLDVSIDKYMGIFMDTYGDTGYSTLNIAYTATIISGEEHADDDVAELKWFGRDEMPSEEDMAFKSGVEIRDAWLKSLK